MLRYVESERFFALGDAQWNEGADNFENSVGRAGGIRRNRKHRYGLHRELFVA